MSADCFFLNPLQRDGTSQRQRAPKALDPAYARIDERRLSDLLAYSRRYAELLSYQAPANHESGDWVDFVEADVTAIVALIRRTDATAAKEAFEAQVEVVNAAATPHDIRAEYAKLFEPVMDIARRLDRWHRDLEDTLAVWRDLDRVLRAALVEALREALAISLRVHQAQSSIPTLEAAVAGLSEVWEMSSVEADERVFPAAGSISDEQRDDAVGRARSVLDRFYEAQVFLAANTESYLAETLDDYPRHQPHMALLLALLRLFEHAQEHLNSLGGAHLDFYYADVLGLQRKPAQPDDAHMVFTLAKNAEPHKVDKGTLLKAGKDSSGVELNYATTDELVVNRAAIDEEHGLKTVFVESVEVAPGTEEVVNIYAAPDADSADGLGADLEDQDGKWSTLGSTSMPFAELGFAIASPMLLLSEGTRVIVIGLHAEEPLALPPEALEELRRNVIVSVTGESGWLQIPVGSLDARSLAAPNVGPGFEYRVEVGADQEAIVAYSAKMHGPGFDTKHPVVKFMLSGDGLEAGEYLALDPSPNAPVAITDLGIVDYAAEVEEYAADSVVRYGGLLYRNPAQINDPGAEPGVDLRWELLEHSHPYKYFRGLELVDLDITLDVDGVRTLVLENDVGGLDPAKPFMPFGPVPKAGSMFYVGSSEVFGKPLTAVKMSMEWADLPTVNFNNHYGAYTRDGAAVVTGNSYFKARAALLAGGTWRLAAGSIESAATFDQRQLFADNPGSASAPPEPGVARVVELDLSNAPLSAAPKSQPVARFDASLRRGFLRLKLEQDFLHRDYPRLLAKAAIDGVTLPRPSSPQAVPNTPYTPVMSSLVVDFEAYQKVGYAGFSRNYFEDRVEQIFQVGPFGHREIFPIADDPSATDVPIDRSLVPQFPVSVIDDDGDEVVETAEGTLMLGIAYLEPPQNLTVLFRVAEGSEDPRGEVQEASWSYLHNDTWLDFADNEILSDGTNGMLRSGIVTFVVPKKANASETLFPGKLHWIKASVRRQTASIPQLIAVHTQATVARFRDQGNAPAHLATALPAGTIAKLKSRDAAIKKVKQPYASFGGRLAEEDDAFRVRVSERLRHKGRAVAIFDYERLVLEEFPEVYKVKCLNHSSVDCEHAPGHVKVVVVPNLRNQNAVDPLRPQLSLNKLDTIREFLEDVASDFATIHVCNPSYEAVRSRFKVRFHSGRDQGLYTTQLQADLIRFLSPWLYDAASDLTFGGRVHRSAILNFVEELEYVDFVTDFMLDQIVEINGVEDERGDLEQAEATTSSAALVSATDHEIRHDIISCGDHA